MNAEKVEQRTEAWFKAKWGKVGGSSVKKMISKSQRDKVFYEAVSCAMEDFELEEGFVNDAMQRGIDLERPALEELEEYLNIQFEEWGWIQSDIPILGISPDGLTADRKVACEIKCPSKEVHTKYLLEDRLPADYHWQCMNYFATIPELEVLYFASYRPESARPLFVKEIRRGEVVKFQANKTAQEWADQIREVATDLNACVESAVAKLNEPQF